jgi:hypothetical protein
VFTVRHDHPLISTLLHNRYKFAVLPVCLELADAGKMKRTDSSVNIFSDLLRALAGSVSGQV